MRRLPVPSIEIGDVYAAAITAFDDEDLNKRLLNSHSTIIEEELGYRGFAEAGSLNLLVQSKVVNDLSVDEMKSVYKVGMSGSKSPARNYYDRLMGAVPHATCPLCGQGKVRNLDHHLPQSKYPAFVVAPVNLVPSCRDCNMNKVSSAPKCEEEQTLHPYFDDFTHERWLHARVEPGSPPALLYEVRLPSGWKPVVEHRLKHHLKVFKLKTAFTLYAAEELSQIAEELQGLHRRGGAELVAQDLIERAGRRENAHRNSWQTAMLYALAESAWFCDKGLLLIRPTLTGMAA